MDLQSKHQHVYRTGSRRRILFLMCGVVLSSSACRMNPQARPVPAAVAALQHTISYAADINSPRLEGAPVVTATFAALSYWPQRDTLAPVESQAQMITIVPTGTAVAAVAGLLRNARVGVVSRETAFLQEAAAGAPAGALSEKKLSGLLPPGVCTSFRVQMKSDTCRLEVQLRRKAEPNAPLEVSLAATVHPKAPAAAQMPVTETMQLTPLRLGEQNRLAMVLPSPFGGKELAALGVLIEISSPPEQGTAEADQYATMLKECRERLSAQAGGRAILQGPQFEAGKRGIDEAIRLLQSPAYMRQALLYLAKETGMPLTEDIALSAADLAVWRLARADANECAQITPIQMDALRSRFETVAYRLLAKALATDPTPPDLEAIAIRHAGEVGRHPSVLLEIVSAAADIEDLEQRLVQENLIYLEDISPAARTRAFEWLAARKRAPEGYDPLTSSKERRNALNRALQEQQ